MAVAVSVAAGCVRRLRVQTAVEVAAQFGSRFLQFTHQLLVAALEALDRAPGALAAAQAGAVAVQVAGQAVVHADHHEREGHDIFMRLGLSGYLIDEGVPRSAGTDVSQFGDTSRWEKN